VRYAVVEASIERARGPTVWLRRWNTIAKWLGYGASFGMLIVAAFQDVNVGVVHVIGAIMTFGLGWFYALIHTWVSYRLGDRRWQFRIAIVVLSVISLGACACVAQSGCRAGACSQLGFLAAVIFGGAAAKSRAAKSLQEANLACANTSHVFTEFPSRLWPSCLPGFKQHLVATFGEWFTALFYFAYFLSFTKK
jgi:hypothetical protein